MKIQVNGNAEIELSVPHGTATNNPSTDKSKFIKTDYQESLLAELMQTYAVADLCLIGKTEEKGYQLIENDSPYFRYSRS